MRAVDNENKRYKTSDFSTRRVDDDIVFRYLHKVKNKDHITSILDIGCGSGIFAKEMLDQGYAVKGIDFAETAVKRALQRGVNAVVGDLDQGIAEPDESYDVVVASDIMEHVYDPMFVLQETYRVLKPGGYTIVNIPNLVTPMVRLWTLFGYSYQEPVYRRYHIYKHHTFFTLGLAKYMLEYANLKMIDHRRVTNLGKKRQAEGRYIPLLITNALIILAQKK